MCADPTDCRAESKRRFGRVHSRVIIARRSSFQCVVSRAEGPRLQYLYAFGIKGRRTRNVGRLAPFLPNHTGRLVADPRTTEEPADRARVSVCAPKRLRIGLIPYDSGVNLYAARLRACSRVSPALMW